MVQNKCLPFCAVFRGMGVDSIPLSKRGERELKPILDDEARQELTERTSTTRTTKGGQIVAAELSRQPCSALVAAQSNPESRDIIQEIVTGRHSSFLRTDFIF